MNILDLKSIEEFEKKGVLVLRQMLLGKQLEELEEALAEFLREIAPSLKEDEINYLENGDVYSIHRLAGYDNRFKGPFEHYLKEGFFYDLAADLLGEKPEGRKIEYFAKPPNAYEVPPHQDNYYWKLKDAKGLNIWVALDEVEQENGGIYYIEGSHKGGGVAHEESFIAGSSQKVKEEIDKNKIFSPNLKIGDLAVHHSLTIHGSRKNETKRSRRGIVFSFKALSSEYDEDALASYRESLKKQMKFRDIS